MPDPVPYVDMTPHIARLPTLQSELATVSHTYIPALLHSRSDRIVHWRARNDGECFLRLAVLLRLRPGPQDGCSDAGYMQADIGSRTSMTGSRCVGTTSRDVHAREGARVRRIRQNCEKRSRQTGEKNGWKRDRTKTAIEPSV